MNFKAFKSKYEKKQIEEHPNQVPDNVLVSVCVQTYNQVKYIKECLDGILMQKTDFNFEILLGEDASTDGTREICLTYAKKFPSKIRLFLHHRENNIEINGTPTGRFNFLYNLFNVKGKYIAMCEGDDYWTDPLKLQKQVDFLENNDDYTLCFHKIKILEPDGTLVNDYITKLPDDYERIETLAKYGNYIHTPSIIFRNVLKKYPNEFYYSPLGDFYLYMLVAKHGKIKRIDEFMAVYRNAVGVWSTTSDYKRNLKTIQTFALITKQSDNTIINEILINRIIAFCKRFENVIIANDVQSFIITKEIEIAILDYLFNAIRKNKSLAVSKTSSKDLIKTVLKRIKNKLWMT